MQTRYERNERVGDKAAYLEAGGRIAYSEDSNRMPQGEKYSTDRQQSPPRRHRTYSDPSVQARADRRRGYKASPERERYVTHDEIQADGGGAGGKNAVRLIICALVLVFVVSAKLMFPEKTQEYAQAVLPVIEKDFDYKAAAQAIGESITGEQSIAQVLGDMYVKAFGGGDTEDIKAYDQLSPQKQALALSPREYLHNAASRLSGAESESVENEKTQTQQTQSEETSGSSAAAETADPTVKAFLSEQEQYSEYALPSNVTYSMPDLGISYGYPMTGIVTSNFGYRNHPTLGGVYFHYGTDIAADTGDSIGAFADGTVTAVAESTSSGLSVTVDHGSGIVSRYAHCDEIYVEQGDTVAAGDVIAAAGQTGNTTGPHLHFELSVGGKYVNPEYYLNFTYA